VVVCSAYRLSEVGAATTRDYTERARTGRRTAPSFAPDVTRSPVGRVGVRALLWAVDPMLRPSDGDRTDGIRVAEAEIPFDVHDRLDRITAPTLVIGGDRDLAYPVALLRETAEGVPDGRLIVYKGRSHTSVATDPRFVDDVGAFLAADPPG
jgi:pimeloyl-ACP methyl ester carboxylesterase